LWPAATPSVLVSHRRNWVSHSPRFTSSLPCYVANTMPGAPVTGREKPIAPMAATLTVDGYRELRGPPAAPPDQRFPLGAWPDSRAAPQPDWPPSTRLVGFPLLFDDNGIREVLLKAESFQPESAANWGLAACSLGRRLRAFRQVCRKESCTSLMFP
jgi:hypothetical protein